MVSYSISWLFNPVLESMRYPMTLLMFITCSSYSPPFVSLSKPEVVSVAVRNVSTNKGHLRSETGGAVRGRCQQRALWAHFEGAVKCPQRFWRPSRENGWRNQAAEKKAFPCSILARTGRTCKERMKWKVRPFVPIRATSFTSLPV